MTSVTAVQIIVLAQPRVQGFVLVTAGAELLSCSRVSSKGMVHNLAEKNQQAQIFLYRETATQPTSANSYIRLTQIEWSSLGHL